MTRPLRFAYADPPYIRQARKHYADDPRCAEVDHVALIAQLERYDGWALSASAAMDSLKIIVGAAPDDARMGVWVKPFASFKPGVDPAYTWEPVLYRTRRVASKTQRTVRDHISEPITLRKGLAGAKPQRFCLWLFDLLGMGPGDELHDLYPGTGIVTQAHAQWRAQMSQQASLNFFDPALHA